MQAPQYFYKYFIRGIAVFGLLMLYQINNAQQLKINSANSYCYEEGSAIQMSSILNIEGPSDDLLNGIQISIEKSYEENKDTFTYTFADNIDGDFDKVNGIFTLSGEASIAAYRNALDRIYYQSSVKFDQPKEFLITLSGVDFFPESGHFYQFFPDEGISWEDAKEKSEQKELFGLKGYLTTITTAAENKFILERVTGTAWIGATDVQEEGIWRWVTGPEKELDGGKGMRLSEGFTNWNDGEPNGLTIENYAHMMDWSSPPGRWNDLIMEGDPPGDYHPTGYLVEFGGQTGDPNVIGNISTSVEVEIRKNINLSGPTSVCPNIEGVVYNATALDGHSYQWTIEGGQIIGGANTDEVTVNWGDSKSNAWVKVLVISDIACTYEETLNVKINEQLDPPAPQGPLAICFDDLINPQVYSTPATPGSTYDWKIVNGQIISGNGSNQIEVIWDQPGQGQLYFTESTSTSTDICDGDSPFIFVTIREQIEVTFDIKNVSCFGGNDGEAQIQLLSNASNLDYEWIVPSNAIISGEKVSSLSAGIYEILITLDDCKKYFTFEITEPEILAGSVSIEHVSCFGETNGVAIANIIGGTGSYEYDWSHNNSASSKSVNDLPAGNHTVRITDENQCELLLNFTITEPQLLLIEDVWASLVSCPGGSDATTEAVVSGGTPPYSFVWENNDSKESTAVGFEKGTYEVKVIDANGCQASSQITVAEAVPKVILPNAFTPNNDGVNDTFGATTPCDIMFKMEVYNRWGQMIFSANSTSEQWDGTYQGNMLESGKYAYAASWAIEANDLVIEDSKRGEIQLIR